MIKLNDLFGFYKKHSTTNVIKVNIPTEEANEITNELSNSISKTKEYVETDTMEPMRITTKARKQYQQDVNNNLDEDYMTVRKKLTRNFLLGELHNENEEYMFRRFGNMIIRLNKQTNHIDNVFNDRIHKYDFNINKEYKKYLEKALGIKKGEQNIW